jgi:hypothetical protein
MMKVRLIAACAALTLVAAACGDDDDDASGESTLATVAAPTIPAGPAEPAGTEPTAAAGEGSGATTAVSGGPTVTGGDVSPELIADCQAVLDFLEAQGDPSDVPEVGDELSDDYREFLEGVVEDLEDLDLQTDEVQSAVDALVDFSNDVLDEGTLTEELDAQGDEATTPFIEACEPVSAASSSTD